MNTNYLVKIEARPRRSNPVARTMNQYNPAKTHRDRKNDFRRRPKHRSRIWEDCE